MDQCSEHSGLVNQVDTNKEDIQEMWKVLAGIKDALNYRLPLWATFLIAALSSACTGLIVRTFT